MVKDAGTANMEQEKLVVVLNWVTELERLLPQP